MLSHALEGGKIPTPATVSLQERIFERDGVLRWKGSTPFAKARIGISLHELLSALAPAHRATGAIRDSKAILQSLIQIHQKEHFLLWYCNLQKTAYIVLKQEASATTNLKAWAVGLSVAHRLTGIDATSATTDEILLVITTELEKTSARWDDCIRHIEAAGWDTGIASLETSSGRRVRMHADNNNGRQSLESCDW